MQVPGLARHHRRAAWEGNGDRRGELDALGRKRSNGERRKDVVPELDRHQRVEAGGFSRGGKRACFAPSPHRQHREDAHAGYTPAAARGPPPALRPAFGPGSAVASTSTVMPSKSDGKPVQVPETGTAWRGSRATATRIRSWLPTIPLVGSNSTQPAPGR